MITGEIKNKVDKIWEIFWTGGIANPLSVIEQITYLLYIKGLDDKQTDLEANAQLLGTEVDKIFPQEKPELRWKNFKQMDAKSMFETVTNKVFPFIKNMDSNSESAYSRYMKDAIFQIPTPQLLEKNNN